MEYTQRSKDTLKDDAKADLENNISANHQGQIASLQALRALAFLGIFTSHARMNSQLGAWGVSVFFVLSGFLMVYSYYDREISFRYPWGGIHLARKKIRKLYLLHIAMIIVAIPFEIHRSGLSASFGACCIWLLKIVSNVTLVQSWFPRFSIFGAFNGVAWYLSATAFLYFMFPLILKRIKSFKNYRIVYIINLLVFALMFAFTYLTRNVTFLGTSPDNSYWTAYTFPVLRLGDFIIGCNLGYIFLQKRTKWNIWIATFFESAIFLVIAVTAHIYKFQNIRIGENWCRYTLLWLPSSAILVYLFAIKSGVITKILTNRVLIWMGNMSPFFFLIHSMIILYFDIVERGAIGNVMTRLFAGININVWWYYRLVVAAICLTLTIICSLIWRSIVKIIKHYNIKYLIDLV